MHWRLRWACTRTRGNQPSGMHGGPLCPCRTMHIGIPVYSTHRSEFAVHPDCWHAQVAAALMATHGLEPAPGPASPAPQPAPSSSSSSVDEAASAAAGRTNEASSQSHASPSGSGTSTSFPSAAAAAAAAAALGADVDRAKSDKEEGERGVGWKSSMFSQAVYSALAEEEEDNPNRRRKIPRPKPSQAPAASAQVPPGSTPLEVITALNAILFDRHGYGPCNRYGNPRDAQLSSVMESGLGGSCALSILYMLVGEGRGGAV